MRAKAYLRTPSSMVESPLLEGILDVAVIRMPRGTPLDSAISLCSSGSKRAVPHSATSLASSSASVLSREGGGEARDIIALWDCFTIFKLQIYASTELYSRGKRPK